MSGPWPEIEAEANHEWLLDHYARLLLAQEPAAVLDVGCGKGRLLRQLTAAGTPVTGLDQPSGRLDELLAEGLDVREGSAYDLPFDDSSVDWVSLRHVPHHLEFPQRALAELLRVARTGVLVAEPYFERSVPSQQAAHLLDQWQKVQHRRRGMFHAEDIDLGGLLSLMPAGFERAWQVEVEQRLRLRARSIERFAEQAALLLDDLPAEHPQRTALDGLLVELEQLGLSWNGSLCVLLRRS